jgi:membrane associated rhomboid family serine protease
MAMPVEANRGVVFKLIVINVIVYALQSINEGGYMSPITAYFALWPIAVVENLYIWQIFTYMFLHGNFWHIFFNMYALLIFGMPIEQEWGGRKLLLYYLFTGTGAGITIFLMNLISQGQAYISPTLGASGAVFGLLLAFGVLFPDVELLIFFILPIKAKYLVVLYGGMELFFELSGSTSNVSHVGHLGGLLFGIIYFIVFKRKAITFKGRMMQAKLARNIREHDEAAIARKGEMDINNINRKTEILGKLRSSGPDALTDDEFQYINYIKIMNEGSVGQCSEIDYNAGDDYCRKCENFDACFLREAEKYL